MDKTINVKLQMTELERSFYNQQIKSLDPASQSSSTALLTRIADALEAQNVLMDAITDAITVQTQSIDAIATAISQLDLTCTVNNYITPTQNS